MRQLAVLGIFVVLVSLTSNGMAFAQDDHGVSSGGDASTATTPAPAAESGPTTPPSDPASPETPDAAAACAPGSTTPSCVAEKNAEDAWSKVERSTMAPEDPNVSTGDGGAMFNRGGV
jgi:hypothetical protein